MTTVHLLVNDRIENFQSLGWQDGRCLERFRAVPDVRPALKDGAVKVALGTVQSEYFLRPDVVKNYDAALDVLTRASMVRKVNVTVDFATWEILTVDEISNQ